MPALAMVCLCVFVFLIIVEVRNVEPVRSRLTSLEAPTTLLRLSSTIYPPGQWLSANKLPETLEEGITES